jgi:hypothetical protein
MQVKRLISKGSIAAIAALGFSAAIAQSPVGELEVQGRASVASEGSDGAIRLVDTTYGWMSGDRVETRSGTAILNLDGGASLGFGENSAGDVSVEDGVVSVQLDSGTMLYALDDQTAELAVTSGEYRFSTQPRGAQAIEVSRESRGAAGMIEVGEEGVVEVDVRSGVLSSTNASGSLQYQVASGESVAFDGADVRQVEVQLGDRNRNPDEEGSFICPGQDAELCYVALGAGAITIGAIAERAISDDDESQQPASP